MADAIQETEIPALAAQMFPVALLYLGSRAEAISTLTEALASAAQDGSDSALRALLRIGATRIAEKCDPALFPENDLLQAVMRLPAGGRRDLALRFSGVPDDKAASARGLTAEEYAQKIDKALRQLTFLQNGRSPDPAALSAAVGSLALTAAETDGIRQRWTAAADQKRGSAALHTDKPSAAIREIVQRRENGTAAQKQRRVPIWGVALGTLCVLLAAAVVALLADRSRLTQKHDPPGAAESSAEEYTVQDLSNLHYIGMDAARTAVLHDLGTDADGVIFTNTRLDTAKTPVCYKITCVDAGGAQYDYTVDAVSGEIQKRVNGEAVQILHTENWLSRDDMRSRALSYTHLTAALTLREQLGEDGGRGFYKFVFQDESGKIYTVQLGAISGNLLKYSVEKPQITDTAGFVPIETARQQAVSRVGDLTPDRVIFTKEKLDGAVYLFSFTLDDGTQYALELDAKTGMTNTLDVHPVSADTSQAIGLLRARDIALEYAEIAAEDVRAFSKAKIDRSNGAYVYELEFETNDYEYVAELNIRSGEIMKYRAQYK